MYLCNAIDDVTNQCLEWVVYTDSQSFIALSQSDSQIIGEWLISFFVLCCAYAVISKAIKLA